MQEWCLWYPLHKFFLSFWFGKKHGCHRQFLFYIWKIVYSESPNDLLVSTNNVGEILDKKTLISFWSCKKHGRRGKFLFLIGGNFKRNNFESKRFFDFYKVLHGDPWFILDPAKTWLTWTNFVSDWLKYSLLKVQVQMIF